MAILAAVIVIVLPSNAAVTQVEPAHTLTKLVDSCAPLHPSQALLDSACAFGNVGQIESVASVQHGAGLYVQISSGGYTSTDSCIFKINKNTGVVSLVSASTGFNINERGTDLLFNPISGLLLTQDQATSTIATIDPATGITGTYAVQPGGFGTGTLGIDIARKGLGDIAVNDVVWTSDVGASGIYSSPPGGPATLHLVPSAPGDDVVVQPDGDWVHIVDGGGPITAYSPTPPHGATASPFSMPGLFTSAGLPWVFGTRAAVCPSTGDVHVSFSGGVGGSGVFRLDQPLSSATLELTVLGSEGIQDLSIGRSSQLFGNSLFFAVHDSGCEEVWELTLPECEVPLAIELASFIAEQTADGVRVSWETITEKNNVGFRLTRERDATHQKHPVVLTPAMIHARGNELQGATYEHLDRGHLAPGIVHYYLEDVDIHGSVTRHGPVTLEIVDLTERIKEERAESESKPYRKTLQRKQ